MAMYTRGKAALKASLIGEGDSKKSRLSPDREAEFHCTAGIDKDNFTLKYFSDYKGFGVISNTGHSKGDFLLQYAGEKLPKEEGEIRIKKSGENKIFFYRYHGKELCIDAEGVNGHICQLVNDGNEDANSAMKLKIFNGKEYLCLYAIRDIAVGEEILYNYGCDERSLWWRCKKNAGDPFESVSSDLDSDPFSVANCSESEEESDTDEEVLGSVALTELENPSMEEEDTCSCSVALTELKNPSMEEKDTCSHKTNHFCFDKDLSDFACSNSKDPDYLPEKDNDQESSDTDEDVMLPMKDQPRIPILNDYVSDSDASETSIVVPIPIPIETTGISVQKTKTEKGKQKWDKRHACKYCGKLYPKLARHLETMHKDEVMVAKALSLPKNSAERKDIWKNIMNEGDWDHNFSVLKDGSGTLIPKYRDGKTRLHDDFIPCSGCKALYSKSTLSEHYKVCVGKATEQKNHSVKEGRYLLPIPEHITDSFYKDVIMTMKQDDIYHLIYQDALILKFGKRIFENKEIQEHTSNHISCRMRELGRLIEEAKKYPEFGINKLEDCFAPAKFNHVVSCVKSVAGFRDNTHMYSTPSLALKIGYSLQRCAKIYRSDGIIESDKKKQEDGSAFIQLYESDWSDLISSRARQTLSENKYNAPKLVPLSEDVYKLNQYLKEEVKELIPKLENDSSYYSELAKVTLCHVTLFNRKRGGDVQRITVQNFEQAIEAQNNVPFDSEIKASLSDLEVELCRTMTRIELKGKQERKVAVLLTEQMIRSINLLMEKRSDANVNSKYLFARPSPSLRTLRARDILHEICEKLDLQYGNLMTYTNLRKHIATMAQIHELSEHGQDQLAKFLGHDIRIHREVYRQPLDIIQKTKISKMLILMNEGKDVSAMSFDNEEEVNESTALAVADGNESEEETNDYVPEPTTDDQGPWQEPTTDATRKPRPTTDATRKPRPTTDASQGSPKRFRKERMIKKTPWTASEMNSIKRNFSHFISMCKVPGKEDIMSVLKKDKALSKRTWRNIKDQVYNLVKKQRKC